MDYHDLTPKQKEWTKHKARWEAMSISAVLREWTPLSDDELCDHGASACIECKFYGEESHVQATR